MAISEKGSRPLRFERENREQGTRAPVWEVNAVAVRADQFELAK